MKYIFVFIIIGFTINLSVASQDNIEKSKYTLFDRNIIKLWSANKGTLTSIDRELIACSINGLAINIHNNLPILSPESRQWVVSQIQKNQSYAIKELETSKEYYIFLLDGYISRLITISNTLCSSNISQDAKTEILLWLELGLTLNGQDIPLSLTQLNNMGIIDKELWGGSDYPELYLNMMVEGILTKIIKPYIQNRT